MDKKLALVAMALVGIAACNDPNALPDATEPNLTDTVTVFAIDRTPIMEPSGFSIDIGNPVRLDLFPAFDFAYNVQSGQDWLYTPRSLGMPRSNLDAGILPQGTAVSGSQWEQITEAPFDGYLTTDSVTAAVGNTYVIRSRVICSIGVPRYGKIEILEINSDPDTLSMTFQVLLNQNCGYRGLEPGVPDI